MSILPFFLEIIINIAETGIYSLLFLQCLDLKEYWKNYRKSAFLIISGLGAVLICLCNFFALNFNHTQIVLFVFYFVMLIFFFQSLLLKKIFAALLPLCVSVLYELIFNYEHRFYVNAMYLFVFILLALLFAYTFQPDISSASPLHIAAFSLIILGMICANSFLDVIISSGQYYLPNHIQSRFQFLSISFLIIFLSLIILICIISHINEKNLNLEQKFHQEKMNKRQLELSIQSIQNIRSWKHDYNNHLITMTALAEEKKYSELLDYLKCLQESLPEHLSYISSGNITIDAIVTNKLMTAKQYQVDFQYSILLPAVCPLTDLELTAVLGNLLDNAIEACQKLRKRDESLKPSIQLSIKPFRDMLQIQLINSSDGKYKETKEDFLQTTKRDDILHGFGLRHVADIVKSANGIIKIQPENTHFTVSILIPLLMQKGEKIS